MKKELEKTYDPGAIEERLYQKWLDKKYFHAEVDETKQPYTIVIPPPNITGKLHMGHALDETLQDILIRFKKMQGYNALWIPGTDHASIATEVKIINALKEEGIEKEDLGREKFLERAWDWKEEYGGTIIEQMKKLGSSCDWDRERFTMDEGCSEAVKEVFIKLYEKGYIYRGSRIINWCPVCQTSISDAEVEYEDQAGHFWHIKYPVVGSEGEYVEIATTRPETLLGDSAVAVHPDDERYTHLVGKMLELPLCNRQIPVVADEYVDREFGTGAVKITPAHDPNDFEVGKRHDLPEINILNDDATINKNGGKYEGMDRYEARKAIVADLEEQGYLVKIKEHEHNVGTHDRCGTTVEPMIKPQWFVKMEELAKPAIEAVKNGDLKFVPERYTKTYLHWLENIRDWCISRQLWWGHRIPAYYCDECGEFVVAKEAPEKCPHCGCTHFTQDDLDKIEKEMKVIIKENYPIERFELPADEAIKLMEEKGEPYKIELIKEHSEKGEPISFYKQGEFTELCAGPHIPEMKVIKAFKLTNCTGAYWRGDEKNKMLCRVYGIAFPKASMLEDYLNALEEAKKRDHNKLGRELELFTTVDYIGQGLPILLPKGTKIIQTLQRWVEDEEAKRGWQLTKTPLMAKSDLYKISGHWDHYKDGMFVMGDEEKDKEVFALRPMTCPFQYQAYLNRPRSYRDLPLRYDETSTLFRNEASGEMHGLIRVRQFTISEGHLMCRPDQLEDEFKACLELTNYMMETIGLKEDLTYRFSLWDPNDREKYLGTEEQWDEAQSKMKNILDDLGVDYKVGIGEAAFYGPKLDVQLKSAIGHDVTVSTCQLDFLLPQRFELEYIGEDGKAHRPVVIHRAILGTLDRFMAFLIEETKGAFPTWLAPVQVKVLPISDKHLEYANKVKEALQDKEVRVEVDDRAEKIGYKIREAQLQKVPYMLVVGDKEQEAGEVGVRNRKDGDVGAMKLEDFVEKIDEEIKTFAK